ncbi:hypothetical protein MPSEU_000710700 [Mayamaea pseudoterrestris]|nr:hypothetical protein MPSEU_000710700 [Mayamaea pseudoterrestris]
MPSEIARKDDSKAIELLKKRLSGFETEEGRLKGFSYQPRVNDVIITTTPKAGTTWMQQICHQLRSDGDMTFDEISEVVPYIELAFDQGQDLESAQFGHDDELPRLFKTHVWEPHCPKAPKTIVVLRHPNDVLVSFYHFFEDWFFEPGTLSLESFAEEFWLARGIPQCRMENASYFYHLTSWYARRADETVLFVFYEDLKEDLEEQVTRIARFLSTSRHDLSKSVPKCVELSSFEVMKANEVKFNEKLSKLTRNEACGLPKTAGMSKTKIRRGNCGVELSIELRARIDAKWHDIVKPVTGCDDYNQLREQF